MDINILISCGVIGGGVVLLMIGGGIFNYRAYTNKRAWEGKTKPFLKAGLLVTVLGIIYWAVILYTLNG